MGVAGERDDMTREEAMTGLELTWGDRFLISEARGEWRAVRVGDPGTLLVAEDPWALRIAMIRNWSEIGPRPA